MFKNHVLRCAMLCFLLLVFAAHAVVADPLRRDDAGEAAKVGLVHFMTQIPQDDLASYGFKSKSEFGKTRLGNPYELYTFTAQFLNDASTPTEESIESTGEVRFPVMVDGHYRALLTVAKRDNKWEAVSFGAVALAGVLETMESSLGVAERASDASKILLRYYQGKCDFVMLKENTRSFADTKLYPVNSGASFLMNASADYQVSYTLEDLQSLIHR